MFDTFNRRWIFGWCVCGLLSSSVAVAEVPGTIYIFPAGGQRGTTVNFRVGGFELHPTTPFEMLGEGVHAQPQLQRAEKTVWFEGPVIPQPESQGKEEYPQDHLGQVQIDSDANPGVRYWRVWNSQGVTPALKFVIGDLPEVVEDEQTGDPLPVAVQLPVTINGRIFPREDVDVWSFQAVAGRPVTCEVNAQRIGSPLDARLEVLDPHGRPVAEDVGSWQGDARLRFTPTEDGEYQVRIHDISYGGLQHYVYRLTVTADPWIDSIYPLGGRRGTTTKFELTGQQIPATADFTLPAAGADSQQRVNIGGQSTNAVLVALDDHPEHLESEPNQATAGTPLPLPAILNGRIGEPGDLDLWPVAGVQGETYEIEVQASRLGSPLDAVLSILDSTGKVVEKVDDLGNETDCKLTYTFPATATYYLQVNERTATRGDARFAYRLRITPPAKPGFRLHLSADALTAPREANANFKVQVERLGGFAGEIVLRCDGLPEQIEIQNATIAANQNETTLIFKPLAAARIQQARVNITGTAKVGEQDVTVPAIFPTVRGELPIDHLLLGVAIPTPFKFKGLFEMKYASRGAWFRRHYAIERNGYTGPFTVRMADRQFRHLQGVRGGTINVAPEANEFDYEVYLPPFMEIGRTSRSTVLIEAEITDKDGSKHLVNYTSGTPEDQIIILVDPGSLAVETTRNSFALTAGGTAEIPFHVTRGQSIAGLPVRVQLFAEGADAGLVLDPVEVAPSDNSGVVTIRTADITPVRHDRRLLLRAVAEQNGKPVVAEATITLVGQK